jgi:hypothetical protein
MMASLPSWQGKAKVFDPQGSFDDVCLQFDGSGSLRAHRIVLSAASPVLKVLLADCGPVEIVQILLPGFDYAVMKQLLQFIYSGEVTVLSKECEAFLEYCNIMGLKNLKEEDIKSVSNDDASQAFSENVRDVVKTSLTDNMMDTTSEQVNIVDLTESIRNQQVKTEPIKSDPLNAVEEQVKIESINPEPLKHQLKVITCPSCAYTTSWTGDMNKHRMAKHEGLRFHCDQCDMKFVGRHILKRHKVTIHKGVRYNCTKCDYITVNIHSFKAHEKSKHEGVRFQCDDCPDKFMYKSTLKKHIQAKHLGLIFYCEHCPKQFRRIDNLKYHTNSIHHEMVVKCDADPICSFSAKTPFLVSMHKKSVHDGSSFNCEDCNFTADTYHKYRKHRARDHSKNKSTCTLCNFEDPEQYKLKQHQVAKHGASSSSWSLHDGGGNAKVE